MTHKLTAAILLVSMAHLMAPGALMSAEPKLPDNPFYNKSFDDRNPGHAIKELEKIRGSWWLLWLDGSDFTYEEQFDYALAKFLDKDVEGAPLEFHKAYKMAETWEKKAVALKFLAACLLWHAGCKACLKELNALKGEMGPMLNEATDFSPRDAILAQLRMEWWKATGNNVELEKAEEHLYDVENEPVAFGADDAVIISVVAIVAIVTLYKIYTNHKETLEALKKMPPDRLRCIANSFRLGYKIISFSLESKIGDCP